MTIPILNRNHRASLMMSPDLIASPASLVFQLNISTESAQILANELQPILNQTDIWSKTDILLAAFVAIIALFSFLVAYHSTQIAKNSYIFSLHALFFDTIALHSQDSKKTNFNQVSMTNFFELIAWSIKKNKLSHHDVELFVSEMKKAQRIDFARKRREKSGNRMFIYYWDWLQAQGLVEEE